MTRIFEPWHLRVWINHAHILSSSLQHRISTEHLMLHTRRLRQCCFCSSVSCVSENPNSVSTFDSLESAINVSSKLYDNNRWIYTKEKVFLFYFTVWCRNHRKVTVDNKANAFSFIAFCQKRAKFRDLFAAAFLAMTAGLSHQLCVPAAIFPSF